MRTWLRPDGRRFVLDPDGPEPVAPGVELYATVDEADEQAHDRYRQLGFTVKRREGEYLIPTDPAVTGLAGVEPPAGFVLVRADEVDETRLRLLDDALRQDVPGTDGWRWAEVDFREETYESPAFDPAVYLVAVEEPSGEHVGIARIWRKPARPRLGLIAVLAPYRRRGLARALLAPAFAVLHESGQAEVSTEIAETNTASRALLEGLGASRVGGSVELVRRPSGR